MPAPLEPAPPRTIIRNAAWLVAWDDAVQSHVYRRDVDLTIEGDAIAAIGNADPAGAVDTIEIDGRGFAVLPGFVDVHAHPSSEPLLKGLTDEVGSCQLYMSSLYEYLPLFENDAEGRRGAVTQQLFGAGINLGGIQNAIEPARGMLARPVDDAKRPVEPVAAGCLIPLVAHLMAVRCKPAAGAEHRRGIDPHAAGAERIEPIFARG